MSRHGDGYKSKVNLRGCVGFSAGDDSDFAEYVRTGDRGLRNRIIERHMGIAHYLARRYRNRGVANEDLVQVATMGLLKAVERFDPERGTVFAAFATPTILGELRRYFRDATWALRVPRQLQERVLAVGRAVGPLVQRLGRSPSPLEFARETGLSEEDVLEALEADSAYAASPLEPASEAGYGVDRSQALADAPEDRPEAVVERRLLVSFLVAKLTDRERNIVEMRFALNMTQSQIAERIGVSQMHVSRMLNGALAKMRAQAAREGRAG
jgi:RNA polymerase sigma-B factor